MPDSKHRDEILDAAAAAFIRYGYKRVTMGDIAEGAGLSRPTLYGVFPNKEAVFRAVVTRFHEAAIEEIRERITGVESLAERLEIAFEVWLVRPYQMMHQSPDAQELVESMHGFAAEAFVEAYGSFAALLTTILEPYAERLRPSDLGPGDLAQFLVASGRGMKAHARDAVELVRLVSGLVRVTVALCQPSVEAPGVRETVT